MDFKNSPKMSDMENAKPAEEKNKETQIDPALEAQLSSFSQKIQSKSHSNAKKHSEGITNNNLVGENEELKKLLEDSKNEIASLKESILRIAADKENAIKRMEKQLSDTSKYAISSFLKDLLPAIDNLYRASQQQIQNDELNNSNLVKNILDGIEITKNDFTKIFEKHGLLRLEPKSGDDFDHNFHQAVATVSDSNVATGKIVSVMQAGYELSGRLIRAAMVTVSA
jgi:molecular chaperone GrpE